MSGHKRATVTISQDEYDRLRESEGRLRSLPDPSQVVQNAVNQRTVEVLRESIGEMQRRQASLDSVISGLNGYVQDLESSTSRAIAEFQDRAIQACETDAAQLRRWAEDQRQQDREQFDQVVVHLHQEYQRDLNAYSREVRRMASGEQQKRAFAAEWLSAAEQFCAFLDGAYPHDMLVPGQVDRLRDRLEQARENLEAGLAEAVVVASQQIYAAFSDLRVELEERLYEWTVLYQAAYERVACLLDQAEQSRIVCAVDIEGEPLDSEVDTDFWTQGRLEQLIDELSRMLRFFDDGQPAPDVDTLEHWLRIEIVEYQRALEEIVMTARIRALNSQLRINIADLVVQALHQQGFSVSASAYDQGDMRGSYHARLVNLEGSEISVQVDPVGIEAGQNELSIRSDDQQQRTEHELKQRWVEVRRSLLEYGIEVGQYTQDQIPEKRTVHRNYLKRRAVREEHRSAPEAAGRADGD